jgi:hypothetical protein
MRVRAGFSLAEVLVALVLFEFAMLALTAAAGVAARDLAGARALRSAGATARNRVEDIASEACPHSGAWTAPASPGLVEHWRVDALGQARFITDSVVIATPRSRGPTAAVARAAALCVP